MQPIRIALKAIPESTPRPDTDVIDITPERVDKTPEIGHDFDWQWLRVGNETPEENIILDRMLAAAKSFVTDMELCKEPRMLTFVGPSGCGKTYMAERICAWMRQHGRGVFERERFLSGREDVKSLWVYRQEGAFLVRWQRLINVMRNGEYGAMDRAAGDWFKAIDDIGTDMMGSDNRATNFAVQKLGDLIDRRVRSWTIVTSNFSRKQIADEFDVRIASRLMRGSNQIVDCTGLRDYSIRREQSHR